MIKPFWNAVKFSPAILPANLIAAKLLLDDKNNVWVTTTVTDNSDVSLRDGDTFHHLESICKIKVSNKIQVISGLMVIFNHKNNERNNTLSIGKIPTAVTF